VQILDLQKPQHLGCYRQQADTAVESSSYLLPPTPEQLCQHHIRKAEPRDYDAIWSIWMQDHVIPWMSFPKQTKEDFVTHYSAMSNSSDIYVLVDNINYEEKIVAVRRIKFGTNEHQHSAEYCSLGVDKDFLGRGYAKFFYQEFEKIAKTAGIKRIQLTQSGGNEAAFHIADKNFIEEAVFPDWLKRNANNADFYVIERYLCRFLDREFADYSYKQPALRYQEVLLPMLAQTEHGPITVQRVKNRFTCFIEDKLILTVEVEPDTSVIQHIGFLTIQLHSVNNKTEAAAGLRTILQQLLDEGRVKKVELFSANLDVIDLCKESGFFVRGEKIASYYENETYKNELGLEYSFFNIADAKQLILAKVSDHIKRESIDEALSECAKTIQMLVDDGACDALAAQYLENITYQMARDELGPNGIFSLSVKPWAGLLSKTPPSLNNELMRLASLLGMANGQ